MVWSSQFGFRMQHSFPLELVFTRICLVVMVSVTAISLATVLRMTANRPLGPVDLLTTRFENGFITLIFTMKFWHRRNFYAFVTGIVCVLCDKECFQVVVVDNFSSLAVVSYETIYSD